jgi:hypothetical protein
MGRLEVDPLAPLLRDLAHIGGDRGQLAGKGFDHGARLAFAAGELAQRLPVGEQLRGLGRLQGEHADVALLQGTHQGRAVTADLRSDEHQVGLEGDHPRRVPAAGDARPFARQGVVRGHGQDLPVQAEFNEVRGMRRPQGNDPFEGTGQGQGGTVGGGGRSRGGEQTENEDQEEDGVAHGTGGWVQGLAGRRKLTWRLRVKGLSRTSASTP